MQTGVAIGELERQARKSFTLWQQAVMEITPRVHSVIACSRYLYMGAILSADVVCGELYIYREVATQDVITTLFQAELQLAWEH